jgi:outer membrane protein TolC
MNRICLLVAVAMLARAADPPTLPSQLTLSQALGIALSNSTNIRTAMAQLEEASGRYTQARSTLLPQVEIGARQDYLTVNLVGLGIPIGAANTKLGPFASMSARAFLSQQILNLSDIRAWQSSRSRQDSSRLLVDNAHELVALRVVSAYLEALRAKASRDSFLEQATLANQLYQLTRNRVNQGAAAELDANRAMQQANSLLQQRQEAEYSYVAAKLNLANILQARITSDYDVADEAAYGSGTPPDRDASIQTALASRADYRSAQASVKAAELQVRSVKASRLPTIQLNVSDGQSGTTPAHNVNTYLVGGTINFPVFTGGRIRGEIQEAEGSLREAQAALDANRAQIETDVQAAISGVQWALMEVETSAGNVKLSRQEVNFTRSRFSQGISDNTEVVNAQDRLEQADNAHIRAQYNLGLARANLARATGAAEKTYRK